MASGLGFVEIGLMASNMTIIIIYNLVMDVHFCYVLLVAYLTHSAAVERVFFQSGLIMRPNRAHVSDDLLEKLVFLKCNDC